MIGAIFEDGGLSAVMHVFKHLVSPILLFIAKFSKDVSKEPKEQFVVNCATQFRIKPKFVVYDEPRFLQVASKKLI